MHQIQIHVLELKPLQAHVEILLDARMVRTPQFRGDKEIFTSHDPFFHHLFQRHPDLFFVAV
jgi:hypothetical protein